MTSRAEIAAAFRAGKALLWDGAEAMEQKSEFICNAIQFASRDGFIHPEVALAAVNVVMQRISPYGIATAWLGNTIGWDKVSHAARADNQEWRHRWLDSLIEEFSK